MPQRNLIWCRRLLVSLSKATGISETGLRGTIVQLARDINFDLPKRDDNWNKV